ncbi:hypothetical protein [Acinetobacter sp. MD2]|uniref:hypothetical protein n=1 Tax=Acinetobacter sp. MD2 TaxID=2600066 RepID=UPI002D1F7C29|nr:hypothetical protein [Acinetobacter sp. MD2]MEB3767553.1 hypothetical protein [Acinetobacter sp. MD2]
MSHLYPLIRRKFSCLGYSLVLASALLGTSQMTSAGAAVDQLSDCLVKSTTAADKTTVLQWTYAALSVHPDLKVFSNVSAEQKDQLDQKLAQVLQRIIIDQCSAQTKNVIQSEGLQAVGQSFQQLGQSAGEDIVKDPAVKQQLQGTLRYIDLNKVAMTFLTPGVLGKIGL